MDIDDGEKITCEKNKKDVATKTSEIFLLTSSLKKHSSSSMNKLP